MFLFKYLEGPKNLYQDALVLHKRFCMEQFLVDLRNLISSVVLFLLSRPVPGMYSQSLARPSTNGSVCKIISTCGKNSSCQEIVLNHCLLLGSRETIILRNVRA